MSNSMLTNTRALSDTSYPVYIEQGLVGRVGVLFKERLPYNKKFAILTDEIIFGLHGETLDRLHNLFGVIVNWSFALKDLKTLRLSV